MAFPQKSESSRPCHIYPSKSGIHDTTQYDPVAQSAEHLPFKQGVRGSNPRWVTRTKACAILWIVQAFFFFMHFFEILKSCLFSQNLMSLRAYRVLITRVVPLRAYAFLCIYAPDCYSFTELITHSFADTHALKQRLLIH